MPTLDTKLYMEVHTREIKTIETLRKYGWSYANLDDVFVRLSSTNDGWKLSEMRCSKCRALTLELENAINQNQFLYCPACEEWV